MISKRDPGEGGLAFVEGDFEPVADLGFGHRAVRAEGDHDVQVGQPLVQGAEERANGRGAGAVRHDEQDPTAFEGETREGGIDFGLDVNRQAWPRRVVPRGQNRPPRGQWLAGSGE